MRLLLALFLTVVSFSASSASARGCDGNTTNCWDPCSGGYVPVVGDSCDTKYNFSKGCYQAVGKCGGGGGNDNHPGCSGSETCFDHCTGRYVRYENSNACTTAFNHSKGCYETIGYCRN